MNTDKKTPDSDDDLGGFDAHDDDSFALEDLEQYPGDLSKFAESTSPLDESGDDSYTEKSEEDSQSQKGKSVQSQNLSDNDPLPPLPKANAHKSALGEDSDKSVPFVRSGAFDDDIDAGQHSSSKDTLEHKNADGDSEGQSAQVYEKIDDEWVLLIKNDLKRSEDRKAATPKQTTEPKPEVNPNKEFQAVEDTHNAEEIDLADFNAHHPSTYNLDEDEILLLPPNPQLENFPPETSTSYSSYATMAADMAANTPVPPPEPVIQPNPNPSIPKPVKPPVDKKKRRTVFFWAIAAVVLLALGYGGYRAYPGLTALFEQKPPTLAPVTHQETPAKLPAAKAELHDTVQADVKATTDTLHIQEEHKLIAETEPIKHEETKPIVNEKPKETPKPSVEPVKKIESKVEMPRENMRPPEVPVAKPSVTSKSITHNNTSVSTSLPKALPPVFTVQVYSSPSKDDATERLERLKLHNATNISMSEQLIRGKTWYRVRFGSFSSRDEAETAARQHGFAQSWIDRVR
ncbi:MAG: SPOR domain-containing protein [Ignavibacteriae bacterium]|nr:SPOR domain-containing protein [Ignavibacteriota bacterium]